MKNTRRNFLQKLFNAAVQACLPETCMESYLNEIDVERGVCILGAGKASAGMAASAHHHFKEKCYGAVVTRYGYESGYDTGNIEVLVANHPVPDENSKIAGEKLLNLARQVAPEVPVVFLISGGGSALLSVPADGISFEEKSKLHYFLLRSGASIDEMNIVRKQLSAVKGGRLAEAVGRATTTLVISDVVGDNPSLIASGPTVQDNSSAQQALEILERYRWEEMDNVKKHLLAQVNKLPPTIEGSYRIVANAHSAIDKARLVAEQCGYETEVITYEQEGEASEIGRLHAEIALDLKRQGRTLALFSGGELTVSMGNATGEGGPNQEYLLSLAIALNSTEGICALACDTDGVDGSKDVAGAYIDEHTLNRAAQRKLSAQNYLQGHDSYTFFSALDDMIVTGPTGTNVNDFRVILID